MLTAPTKMKKDKTRGTHLCLKHHSNILIYLFGFLYTGIFPCFSIWELISGTTINATRSEDNSENVIVKANGSNISSNDFTSPIGKKTATVVKVDEVIAAATSLVESTM